jgi:putative transposase
VLTELRNRGVRDVLIACCDGLEGLPDAIETVWPHTTVQTCVVHLIRACMRYISYTDRKATTALLRPVYTAPTEDAALDALGAFADSNLGKRYPGAVAVWETRLGALHPVPRVPHPRSARSSTPPTRSSR